MKRLGWGATTVVAVALSASQTDAAGFVPVTPLFGPQYLVACALATVGEAIWLLFWLDRDRWKAAAAVCGAKGLTCPIVMFGYVLVWGGLFHGAEPLWSFADLVVNAFDLLLVPIALGCFLVADAMALRLVLGVESSTPLFGALVRANLATHLLILLAFATVASTR